MKPVGREAQERGDSCAELVLSNVRVSLFQVVEKPRPVAWGGGVRVSLAVDRMVDDKAKMAAWRSRSAALLTFRVGENHDRVERARE